MVGMSTARHALHSQIMHGEESEVESSENPGEAEFTEFVVHPSTGEFGNPVVETGQEGE